jgi:hypothetical protein
MLVLPPGTVSDIAGRIERAYFRHCPMLPRTFTVSPVWGIAAAHLVAIHQAEPDLPLDPELFVAVQVRRRPIPDPWGELARPSATRRYRAHVRRIVIQLRRELRSELQQAERRHRAGQPLEAVLRERRYDFSPLGRYLFACRHGRPDLASDLRVSAAAQHESCPLYAQACRTLIPTHAYPVFDLLPGHLPTALQGPPSHAFSLN